MLLCVITFFEDLKLIEDPQSIHAEHDLIDQPWRAPEEYDSRQANSSYKSQSEQGARHGEDNEMTRTLLRPGEILKGTGFQLKSKLRDGQKSAYLDLVGVKAYPRFPAIELTCSDFTRWKMAWRLAETFKRADIHIEAWGVQIIRQRCKDWPNVDEIFDLPIALGFSIAALIYGGLHALAWSAHFDSFTEQLLWRMSACVVMGGVPVCYIIVTLTEHCERPKSLRKGSEHRFIVNWNKVFSLIEDSVNVFLCLILLAYILARAYLVVESFINLAHLPAGAYEVPRWSAYFPNFS